MGAIDPVLILSIAIVPAACARWGSGGAGLKKGAVTVYPVCSNIDLSAGEDARLLIALIVSRCLDKKKPTG
jgi:hypothetical protein